MSTPARLMIVFHDMKLGGIQKKTIDIVNYLQNHHPEVKITICLRHKEGIFLKQIPSSIPVVSPPFHTSKLDQIWFTFWMIFQILQSNPTHILTFMDLGTVPTLTALNFIFWKKPRVSIGEDILTSKYVYTETFPRLRLWLIRRLYPQATHILVQTPIQKKDLITIIGPQITPRIQVSPNWLPLDFPPSKPSFRRSTDIVFVGRLDYQKNLFKFIEVVKQVSLRRPQVKVKIIGDGPLRPQIIKLIKQNRLTSNIVLVPATLNPIPFYLDSKIFLLTSDYEGFPLTLMEAISCGCYPVINNLPEISHFFNQKPEDYLFSTPLQAVALINHVLAQSLSVDGYYQTKLFKLQSRAISQYTRHLID